MSSQYVLPDELQNTLGSAVPGTTLILGSGTFVGPVSVNQALTLVGAGASTRLFTASGPAVRITVPGVRLESLSIAVDGDDDAIALVANEGCVPVLVDVTVKGRVKGRILRDVASGEAPAIVLVGRDQVNLGKVYRGSDVREIKVVVDNTGGPASAANLTVRSSAPWISSQPLRIRPLHPPAEFPCEVVIGVDSGAITEDGVHEIDIDIVLL